MKQVYRIEIGDKKYWIGIGGQLTTHQSMAIPMSFDDHISVMERIGVPATAYYETYDPNVHTFAKKVYPWLKSS